MGQPGEVGPAEYTGRQVRVRPYVITGGRTHTTVELPIEVLVSTSTQRPEGRLPLELQAVRALCSQTCSVAEVAALLSLPLGVARVLISDLAELGLVEVHHNESTRQGRPQRALMERVLAGLQRL